MKGPHEFIDTHIAGVFLGLLCKIITRSDHRWEAAFAPLMLKLLSIGNLQEKIHLYCIKEVIYTAIQ